MENSEVLEVAPDKTGQVREPGGCRLMVVGPVVMKVGH